MIKSSIHYYLKLKLSSSVRWLPFILSSRGGFSVGARGLKPPYPMSSMEIRGEEEGEEEEKEGEKKKGGREEEEEEAAPPVIPASATAVQS